MATHQQLILSGYIFAYFEQGWEGRIDYAFAADNSKTFLLLNTGDKLTVYNRDDSLLFKGEIKFRKRRFWHNHNLDVDIWSYVKQKSVSYEKWMSWFWHKPHLRAKLIKIIHVNNLK